MYKELSDYEYDALKRIGQVLMKYSFKGIGDTLENYQLATMLMLVYYHNILHTKDCAKFRYDLESNHVLITEVSPTILEVWNLVHEDDDTFRFCKPADSIKNFFNSFNSSFRWPDHLKGFIRLCCLYPDLLSILNFVLGCYYWDPYSMYHLLINRKAYLLTADIIFNEKIHPFCYLPDIPDSPMDIEDFLELFQKVKDYILTLSPTENYPEIETPELVGLIPTKMYELSDKMSEVSPIGIYRCANMLRSEYLHLANLEEGIPLMLSSFYDFGVIL